MYMYMYVQWIDRGFFVARCGPLGHTPTRIEPPKPFRAQVWSPCKCARLSWPVRPAERTRGLPIRGVEILPDMAPAAGPSRTVRVDRDGARRRRCGPAGRCAASVQPAGRQASASLRSGGTATSAATDLDRQTTHGAYPPSGGWREPRRRHAPGRRATRPVTSQCHLPDDTGCART